MELENAFDVIQERQLTKTDLDSSTASPASPNSPARPERFAIFFMLTFFVGILLYFCVRRLSLRRNAAPTSTSGSRPQPPPPTLNKEKRSEDVMKELPEFDLKEENQNETCPICLDLLNDNDRSITAGSCLHGMHRDCLHTWLVKDPSLSCPICRRSLAPPEASSDQTGTGVC